MGAVRGHKKAGGRQKGTPNKKSQDLIQRCEDFGFDPFEALLSMARDSEDELLRFNAVKELCQYLFPKRKALEVSGPGESGIKVTICDYTSKEK